MPSVTLTCARCGEAAAHAFFHGSDDGLVNLEALQRLSDELLHALVDAGWLRGSGGLFCPSCKRGAPS